MFDVILWLYLGFLIGGHLGDGVSHSAPPYGLDRPAAEERWLGSRPHRYTLVVP